jgi:hypothetical protein
LFRFPHFTHLVNEKQIKLVTSNNMQ